MSSEGTPLHGDRGAYNVMAFDTEHAKDIMDSTLRRHLPLPGADGGYARSDGTDWQRVSSIALAGLAGYAAGFIIVGGAADWEAAAFDWDTLSAGAGADMVHTHASAGEGGQISHDSALTGVSADDHHNEIHVINSTGPHAETGLTIGHSLRATGAAAFSFAAIAAGDLPTAIDAAKIADGSVSNTEFQYLDDYATIGLVDLTAAEVNQLENIASTTISAAQWAYLGALDQSLIQAASPTFAGLTLSGLGAGAVQSSAGGVLSSAALPLTDLASYTQGYIIRGGAADWEAYSAETNGAALVGDGTDITSTVTPTWLGGHTFMQGMALIGNTGINIVTIKGNVAKGLHVVDNVLGGACEYLTFVTTTGAETVVINELGYDLDFRVEAVGVANAFVIDGATGHIGVATVPDAANIFTIMDNAVTTTTSFYGARYTITKTAGATDVADAFAAVRARMTINDAGVTHGATYGIFFEAVLTDGIIGSIATPRNLIGASGTAQQVAGVVNGAVRGGSFFANQDGGTADDTHGVYIDVDADGTVNNSVYMLYLNERSNVDYGIYQSGTAPHYFGGNLKLGLVGAAQGLLHGYDSISGFLHWEYDGVDGTARTVIPNGAGDVVYQIHVFATARASDGSVGPGAGGSYDFSVVPGASASIYSVGGNVLTLAVAADGSVTVQRTADAGGGLTYKVGLWLLWL